MKKLILVSLLLVMGCATPIGMYGHNPEVLWLMKTEEPNIEIPRYSGDGTAVVIKRFENASLVPIGGHFIGEEPCSGCIAQSYAPYGDISPAIYEATVNILRANGYPVWKDYLCDPMAIAGPIGYKSFLVYHGVIRELEIDTFQDKGPLDEAARTVIDFEVLSSDSRKLSTFQITAKVRIRRGSGDVLEALGFRVARELAVKLNAGATL